MSEPEVEWYVKRIKEMLGEIDSFMHEPYNLTNSVRELICHNVNEIEIDLYIIIRKLSEKAKP